MPRARPAHGGGPRVRASAIVFDVGGVLLDWNPRHIYDALIPDPVERERFLADVCSPAWNGTLDAGRSFDDACAELVAIHPGHADLIRAWKRQDEMIGGAIPGMAELVGELRATSTPRYLLTNMPRWVFDDRVRDHAILRDFDGAVVSGDEGVLKPDPAIFDLLVTRFDLDRGTTLFVDDAPVNVDGARAAGLLAHRFTDAATLRAELVDLGLR